MIPASELAGMEATVNTSLDTSCVIRRYTHVQDNWGSETDTSPTTQTVMCTLAQPTAAQMQNYAYLIGSLATWRVRFPYGTDVKNGDRLVVDGMPEMIVQTLLGPHSYAVGLSVLASEVR